MSKTIEIIFYLCYLIAMSIAFGFEAFVSAALVTLIVNQVLHRKDEKE